MCIHQGSEPGPTQWTPSSPVGEYLGSIEINPLGPKLVCQKTLCSSLLTQHPSASRHVSAEVLLKLRTETNLWCSEVSGSANPAQMSIKKSRGSHGEDVWDESLRTGLVW